MASELGGSRGAQLVATVAAIPFCLGGGALMQYVSFDYFFWVLTAYFVVRLLKSDNPRWWLAIGCTIGLGMMSKYTMGFFAIGIVVGVVLTPARKHLASKWLWIGVALSVLVWLPNLIWQAQNHFISLEFLRTIHERDVRIGRTQGFVPEQFKLTLLALPLCIAGLYFYLFSKTGSRFRMLGWMYIVPLLLFVVAKGRWYYLAGAYPMLYAAGAVWGELWLKSIGNRSAVSVRALVWIALIADIILLAFVTIPTAPVNSALWKFASKNNGDLVEELGWPELVQRLPAAGRSDDRGSDPGLRQREPHRRVRSRLLGRHGLRLRQRGRGVLHRVAERSAGDRGHHGAEPSAHAVLLGCRLDDGGAARVRRRWRVADPVRA